ncbi:MAG TPA: hypothetical protein VM943_08500 [Pyrinomonadaceae bacterium]|nr:hypothetical protein [Pyrinomonadaceae bacterium]
MVEYKAGGVVRIKTGAFAAFTARVEEVSIDQQSLRVIVTIFGRSTPVDVSFRDAEKIDFTDDPGSQHFSNN